VGARWRAIAGMVPRSEMSLQSAPLPHSSSVDGRVAGPTLRAVDEEAVDLIVLGVHQDRPAVAAKKIDGVRAGDKNGWRVHRVFGAPGFHDLQFSCWICHDLPMN
jgi:hypothetical protein